MLGIRLEKQFCDRNLSWQEEVVLIEIGMLGVALSCASLMPSIVGETISKFFSDNQKKKYLKPILRRKLICEKRSNKTKRWFKFFWCNNSKKKIYKWVLNGQKRFILGAKSADYFFDLYQNEP